MAKGAATSAIHRALSAPGAATGDGVLAQLLAKARPLGRLDHGRSQCHARTPSPTAGDFSSRQPPSSTPAAWPPRAPTSSISARNRRGPMAARSRCRPTRSAQRLEPILPAAATIGIPVSIDTIKAAVAAWALEAGASIVNDVWGLQRDPDMARVVAEHGAPVIIMHNRETRRSRDRHYRRRDRVLLALARNRLARRHRARPHRARSRHRLRQDAGAELDLHRAARCLARFRPAAPGRRLAQALHQFDRAVGADGAARRLARRASARGRKRRGHHPRPRRRAHRAGASRSPPPSGTRDERRDLRQRTGAPRLSRRDAARSQGRADVQARSRSRHRSCRRLAHRQAQGHRLLRHGGEDGERGVLRAAATGWSKPRPAPSPTRCWSAARRCAASASPSTSRTRRSPRPSTTSASSIERARARKHG